MTAVERTYQTMEKPARLQEKFAVREPQLRDHKAYTETLRVLTTVGEVSEAQFGEVLEHWHKSEVYHPRVIVDEANTVVAVGMLLVEQKIIHDCGKVGHIEDIAVAAGQQGKRLGDLLIQTLTAEARARGCYKVILDCLPENVRFYEKCGYTEAGVEMQHRF